MREFRITAAGSNIRKSTVNHKVVEEHKAVRIYHVRIKLWRTSYLREFNDKTINYHFEC